MSIKQEVTFLPTGEAEVWLGTGSQPEGSLKDWIAHLQSILDAVPTEYQDEAIVVQDHDGSMDFFYSRPMTAAEKRSEDKRRKEAASQIANIAAESTQAELDEWIRQIRLRTNCSRSEAMDAVASGSADPFLHPRLMREFSGNKPWQRP